MAVSTRQITIPWPGWIAIYLAPFVQKVDSTIHWINHYPVENVIGLPTTYPLDSNIINLLDSAIQLLNNQGQLEGF